MCSKSKDAIYPFRSGSNELKQGLPELIPPALINKKIIQAIPPVLGSLPRYVLLPEREIIESTSILESNPSGTTALNDFQRLAVIIVDGTLVLRDFQL